MCPETNYRLIPPHNFSVRVMMRYAGYHQGRSESRSGFVEARWDLIVIEDDIRGFCNDGMLDDVCVNLQML